ncbi:uncharacterized protein PAC_15858 [Phialocephala subalpina]|uniref:RanBP2-type domain-containing protein n=1 Tax=Phialocephala subalpina TaxID=576137 RepID=A0A1L7XLR7_9HELO|nr:uncharacterized protein PAC_15858 [Phialocephala subalpina]
MNRCKRCGKEKSGGIALFPHKEPTPYVWKCCKCYEKNTTEDVDCDGCPHERCKGCRDADAESETQSLSDIDSIAESTEDSREPDPRDMLGWFCNRTKKVRECRWLNYEPELTARDVERSGKDYRGKYEPPTVYDWECCKCLHDNMPDDDKECELCPHVKCDTCRQHPLGQDEDGDNDRASEYGDIDEEEDENEGKAEVEKAVPNVYEVD